MLCTKGVCHYVITAILKKIINVYKFFNINQINQRIRQHNFGPNCSNKIGNIKPDMINKTRRIKSSAAEMLSFFQNFGLLVGDFVTENVDEWDLYILLRDIFSIVLSKSIQPGAPELLKILIKEHHELYIKCFNENLKPKFHFMLHYPYIISQIGPLPQTWSMGLEQKHQEFKKIAKAITCRINLIETFAIKEQLCCANFLLNNDFIDEIKKGPTTKIAVDAIKKYN